MRSYSYNITEPHEADHHAQRRSLDAAIGYLVMYELKAVAVLLARAARRGGAALGGGGRSGRRAGGALGATGRATGQAMGRVPARR